MKLYLPQLLGCFPLFRGDVVTVQNNKHEACHSGQDVDREMQARAGLLLYMLKRVVVHLGESSSSGHYI